MFTVVIRLLFWFITIAWLGCFGFVFVAERYDGWKTRLDYQPLTKTPARPPQSKMIDPEPWLVKHADVLDSLSPEVRDALIASSTNVDWQRYVARVRAKNTFADPQLGAPA